MSMIGALLAFASGIAARLPRPQVNPDVEITRLREELAEARRDVDALRLAMMRLIEERRRPVILAEPPDPRLREIVDCTGGGRYAYLGCMAHNQAAAQQQYAQAAAQMMNAMNAQQGGMTAQNYPFVQLGQLAQNILGQIPE